MFTGLVQSMGRVTAIESTQAGVRLILDRRDWSPPHGASLSPGDSICVAGVCLSLVRFTPEILQFDVVTETLNRTTLGRLQAGDAVNLESSLTASAFFGGHFVQGHIDGIGEVTAITSNSDDHRVTIRPPNDLLDYIVPKGSITVDGVSLTIASVHEDQFDVALIPTTLRMTTLGSLRVGDRVNLESDILSRTVVHVMRQRESRGKSAITRETLQESGLIDSPR